MEGILKFQGSTDTEELIELLKENSEPKYYSIVGGRCDKDAESVSPEEVLHILSQCDNTADKGLHFKLYHRPSRLTYYIYWKARRGRYVARLYRPYTMPKGYDKLRNYEV